MGSGYDGLGHGSEKDWCSAQSGLKPASVNRVLMDCSHACSFAYPSVTSFMGTAEVSTCKSQRDRNLTFYRHFLNPLYEQGDSDSTQLAACEVRIKNCDNKGHFHLILGH